MKQFINVLVVPLLLLSVSQAEGKNFSSKEELGEALYSDKSLSKNKKMSCATCHHSKTAFVDKRKSRIAHMVAASADRKQLGDRNVPTASYAAFIPEFHTVVEDGETLYIGGQFLDGRAKNLKEQAMGPFLNPVEMQMPSKEAVIKRIKKKKKYVKAFKRLYGENMFNDVDATYEALADAIGKFETTDTFSPFDSRYDRFLEGKAQLNESELRGLALFSDTTRANCVACHPIAPLEGERHSLFTDFTYDNLGVPTNEYVRSLNGKGSAFVDHGLLGNPQVTDTNLDGAFRVSTLRNVGATGPYMHNGVFKTLKTVVHFYNTRDVEGAINPETGKAWRVPEVPATINDSELGDLGLTDQEEDDIVAFMLTLTDKRYQKLQKKLVKKQTKLLK